MKKNFIIHGIIGMLFIWLSTKTLFHLRYQEFYFIMILNLFMSYKIYKNIHILPAIAFFYLIFSGAMVSFYPVSPYLGWGDKWMVVSDINGSHAMIYLAFISIAILISKAKNILHALASLAIMNSFLIIILAIFIKGPFAGIMLNLSMDASFIACLYPYILHKQMPFKNSLSLAFKIAPIIAIVLCKSSIGVGAFCLGLAIYIILTFLKNKNFSRWAIGPFAFALTIPLIVFAIAFFNDPDLFSTNMRYENWTRSIKFFNAFINKSFGSGIGTYWSIGPKIEDNNLFTFMHSDWLQAIFELGFIGFIIILILFIHMLITSFQIPWLFSCVLTYGSVALFNMPTKFSITSLLGALLIKMAYLKGIFKDGSSV